MVTKKSELQRTGGARNFNTRSSYIRNQKFVIPLCESCQAPGKITAAWWEKCDHDPYFHWGEMTIPGKRLFEDIPGPDGENTGAKRLVGQEDDEVISTRMPNVRQYPMSGRHKTGGEDFLQGKFRRKGFKRPEEVGVAPFCEMRNCFSHDIRKFKNGMFCSEEHAVLIAADDRQKHLEVFNEEKRAEQLAGISV